LAKALLEPAVKWKGMPDVGVNGGGAMTVREPLNIIPSIVSSLLEANPKPKLGLPEAMPVATLVDALAIE
jgi:hypothetical protein